MAGRATRLRVQVRVRARAPYDSALASSIASASASASARANAPMIWRKCKGECESSPMISALEFDCERECECAYDKARTLLQY